MNIRQNLQDYQDMRKNIMFILFILSKKNNLWRETDEMPGTG